MPETLFSLSQQLYTDLVSATTHQVLVDSLLKEQLTRKQFGPPQQQPTPSPVPTPQQGHSLLNGNSTTANGHNSLSQTPGLASTQNSAQGSRQPTPGGEVQGRQNWVSGIAGRDVFGQEKVADSARYFACVHCGRRIAGNRFAVHLDRCLGGRARK
jgi:SAGA-associated factor 11